MTHKAFRKALPCEGVLSLWLEIQEAYGDGAPVAARSRYAAVPGKGSETGDDYSQTHGAVLSGNLLKNRLVTWPARVS
jgi:hypothetical protein